MKARLFKFIAWANEKFDRADRWITVKTEGTWFRFWWSRLWMRKDEFHPAYDIDWNYHSKLKTRELKDQYQQRFIGLQNKVHKATL